MKKKPLVKKTLIRVVVNDKHWWVKPDGSYAPFDCNYLGAIKKKYGMTRKQATEMVSEIAKEITKRSISAIVIFYKDPRV